MLLDAGRAFAAMPAAEPWEARPGPAWVELTRAAGLGADAPDGDGGGFHPGWWASEPPGPPPEAPPIWDLDGVPTVSWPPGAWEVGEVGFHDDLPFALPPLAPEPEVLHDTPATATPIDPDAAGAVGGVLGPAERVDYYKLEAREHGYRLAFGNLGPGGKGGQRIWLLDGHGRMLTSLVMPSGKGVVTVDVRRLQPPGEPLYIGIAHDDAATGLAEVTPYWVLVEAVGRSGDGAGAVRSDFDGGVTAGGPGRGQGAPARPSGASSLPGAVAAGASEAVIAGAPLGLATGPLPRLATGLGRGLLAPAFSLAALGPDEGPALDVPAQAFDAEAEGGDRLAHGSARPDPGPLIALGGSRLPLLAAASLGTPAAPFPTAPEAGGRARAEAAVPTELAEARDDERRAARRLPAGLGLATVLAVSLILPDFAASRPGGFLRRRLGLVGAGGGGRRPAS
jgi:hypothetical protein